MRLVDGDIVEPGPTPRWPLGAETWGLNKVDALKDHIARHYTGVAVEPVPHLIGHPRGLRRQEKPEWEIIDHWLDGAELIFDATAETRVSQFLAEEARQRRLPFVTAYGSLGAWGGLVARILPDGDACWNCLQCALSDGLIPVARFDPDGEIQPVGCGDRSFTGAGFDLEEVSLEAVRTIVGLLSNDSGYPRSDWDVAVLNHRDGDGRRIAPRWKTHSLKRHPKCECHG